MILISEKCNIIKQNLIELKKAKQRSRTDKGVIESGNEYEFAVGGELGEGDSRELIVNEGLQQSTGAGIPNLTRAIVASGNDEGTVAVEVNGGNWHGVCVDDVDALAGLNLPNPNGLVEGAGDDVVRLGVEVDAEDGVGVAAEGLDAVAAGGVPDAEGAVVGGGAYVVGVGGPGEVGDALGVAGEAVEEGEGGGGPYY